MSWIPTPKEIASVMGLDAEDRYQYLIKKIADHENVWSLGNESGWALAADSTGREAVPIWPHEQFAKACAKGEWAGYKPKSIALSVWLNRWVQGMERDSRVVAAFPTSDDKGIIVTPRRIGEDLRLELENYE